MNSTILLNDDLDKAFKAYDHFILLEKQKNSMEEIKRRTEAATKRDIEELSTMSDHDILIKAVKRWVQMSSSRNIINNLLEKGENDKAFREFKRMLNESGSGGGMISFIKTYQTIEIKAKDGRLFHPTEQELWKIHFSLWEFENTPNLFNQI